MSSISGAPTINPPEPALKRPQRIRVVVHAFTSARIHPAPDPPPPDPAPPAPAIPAPRDGRRTGPRRQGDAGRHHLDESSWLDVAERLLSAWPVTLRLVALTAVLATGTTTEAAAVALVCQLAVAGLGIRARVRHRARVRALRLRTTMTERPGAARGRTG